MTGFLGFLLSLLSFASIVACMVLLASVTWAWAVGAEVGHGVMAGTIIGGVVGILAGIFSSLPQADRLRWPFLT